MTLFTPTHSHSPSPSPTPTPLILCFHCGEKCPDNENIFDEKHFCCDGCKAVYRMLNENGLCGYYEIDESKGISPKLVKNDERFAYLEDISTQNNILTFQNEEEAHVQLSLPQMHCSSCVWLLEHLYKLNPAILRSQTDFIRKSIFIAFKKNETSLRQVVELLATLGYEPDLKYIHAVKKEEQKTDRSRIYRLTVAGFCFGNIMLLSFPEYLSSGYIDHGMNKLFSILSLGLSLPVLIYSGGEFFVSAWQGLRAKFLNIDLPLSLSLAITFGRSVYEIVSGTGNGYLDSMAGIIFFMLIGRYFQDRTQANLQFDRDFKSFFPISIRIRKEEGITSIPLSKMEKGDRIIIRSQELIPADAILMSGSARIDYSFVTGESKPEHVEVGSLIYAGGRQTAGQLELEVVKEVEQSYLTKLWNRENQKSYAGDMDNMVHRIARHFTLFLLLLSFGSFFYWLPTDMGRGVHALTTILIVACPCSLLLSATFTHAAIISVLGKNGVFLKNAGLLEKIANIRHIVWDKTGTITSSKNTNVHFEGISLTEKEKQNVHSVCSQSNHPLSQSISNYFSSKNIGISHVIADYQELPGQGISARVEGDSIEIGNAQWLGVGDLIADKDTRVYVKINGEIKGFFSFGTGFRAGLKDTLEKLKTKGYRFSVLSGDKSAKAQDLRAYFGEDTPMHFGCSPHEKQDYIEKLRQGGEEVMMIGDGLNDAGALMQSNIGWAVSEDINNFTPASDVIMESKSFEKMAALIDYIGYAKKIVIGSFILSLMYNVVGLSIAVQGQMSPFIAAILMPASSISIILFTTSSARIVARIKALRTSSI